MPLNREGRVHSDAVPEALFLDHNGPGMMCASIMARNTEDALREMALASACCDLLEVRLDAMGVFDLEKIIQSAKRPVLITYRSIKEGGRGNVSYDVRVDYLLQAVQLGAQYIDVEYTLPMEHRRRLLQDRGGAVRVISKHFRNGTPSKKTLCDLLQKMAATGARAVKIVTHARTVSDNLTVLELIPRAKEMGVEIIAFCMGPLGRISRIACPVLGGAFTFVSRESGRESAPGQIPAKEMKYILELLG